MIQVDIWDSIIPKEPSKKDFLKGIEIPILRETRYEDLRIMTMALFAEAWCQQIVPLYSSDTTTASRYQNYTRMAYIQGGILNKHTGAPSYTVDEFHAQDYDEHQRIIAESTYIKEPCKKAFVKWHHNLCKTLNELCPTKYREYNRKKHPKYG